ncbi:MAG: TatD family hydrolase [Rhodothermales bacterium]
MLIDTHAHLYLDRFESDLDAVLDRARAADVQTIVLPAIDVPSIHRALALCEQREGFYAMAALHPSETESATMADFEEVATLCDHPRVVAVGESGLDYYWDRSFDDKQYLFLRQHVRLAIEKDLPLILHSRDKKGSEAVFQDLVRILDEERQTSDHPERLRGIFHCFGGPAWLAETAHNLGFLVGLGGTLTFKNSGVADVVQDVPMEQIVLETDAPYLAPAPHRGKRNEPAYTRLVAEKLAEVKGMSVEEIERITTENARQIFGLKAGRPADVV